MNSSHDTATFSVCRLTRAPMLAKHARSDLIATLDDRDLIMIDTPGSSPSDGIVLRGWTSSKR